MVRTVVCVSGYYYVILRTSLRNWGSIVKTRNHGNEPWDILVRNECLTRIHGLQQWQGFTMFYVKHILASTYVCICRQFYRGKVCVCVGVIKCSGGISNFSQRGPKWLLGALYHRKTHCSLKILKRGGWRWVLAGLWGVLHREGWDFRHFVSTCRTNIVLCMFMQVRQTVISNLNLCIKAARLVCMYHNGSIR